MVIMNTNKNLCFKLASDGSYFNKEIKITNSAWLVVYCRILAHWASVDAIKDLPSLYINSCRLKPYKMTYKSS